MRSLEDRLYDLACQMAQELQEIRNDCVECSGDEADMADVKAMLEDWNRLSADWLAQPRTADLFDSALNHALNEGDGVYRP